ncbi:Class II abasic (AP) endonuclease [Ophidiomyces ophidiicola]|nr:Class II abasic (AP) endonuclease [Ophidiomyces ophidiicola]
MFELLEADIVVFQETKIQEKDLKDDMVLIPGWDCFFSLPKQKKGYSGVVIYTKCSVCLPIRAEEGLTGILTPRGSITPYRELSGDSKIGGYPTVEQLELLAVDPAVIDSEGRCVILEFPAFVLLGVYCPANRDEARDTFRLAFLKALDMRVRNLVDIGKRVIVMGDLNISREIIDSAHSLDSIRKHKSTEDDFIFSPPRRLFNQLVKVGNVNTKSIEKETAVMLDICRKFHPNRQGMYTCWEQRVNARPGNYGARIDYVLCTLDMEEWFSSSDIQEGLMGSDHCPVYAVLQDTITIQQKNIHILDVMNPPGSFQGGIRKLPSSLSSLPLSGRLIPEFHRRRSVKDMFRTNTATSRKGPSSQCQWSAFGSEKQHQFVARPDGDERKPQTLSGSQAIKRAVDDMNSARNTKRPRVPTDTASSDSKSQLTLTRYMAARPQRGMMSHGNSQPEKLKEQIETLKPSKSSHKPSDYDTSKSPTSIYDSTEMISTPQETTSSGSNSRDSWAQLFTKKAAPLCEGHNEPCITLSTKKSGLNRGRSFWICQRPLGPNGDKEKGTPWRCSTFIWCSDWKSQK